ncbi:hypothetical protein R2571_005722 [Pseudomonas aeruginosa]|nr:hypothetical protein [Pseudomonas aeruginosa]
MIELFVALVFSSLLVIAVWEWLVQKMSINAKRVYRWSGLIGVPVHEASHALVCIVFGMRITRMALYEPNEVTGRMGHVAFRYSPFSVAHGLGMALQAVAPLLAGAVLVHFLLAGIKGVEAPVLGVEPVATWLIGVITATLSAAWQMTTSGPLGLLAVVLAMIVSMHAVPSLADIKTGMRGLIILGVIGGAVAIAADIFWVYEGPLGKRFGDLVALVIAKAELGLWKAVYGVLAVVVMSVAGGVMLILLPSSVLYMKDFIRGARGAI